MQINVDAPHYKISSLPLRFQAVEFPEKVYIAVLLYVRLGACMKPSEATRLYSKGFADRREPRPPHKRVW